MTTESTVPTRSPSRMTSPAALIGAGVLIASLGAAAGWMIHSSHPADATANAGNNPQLALAPNESVVTPASAPVQQGLVAQTPAPTGPVGTTPAAVEPPAPHHVAQAPVHHGGARTTHPAETTTTSTSGSRSEPVPTQHVAVCQNCGVVEGVRAVQHKGEGSGVGAVTGAVLGGVIGHQMGGGSGKGAMTVLGTIGGGLAGNEIEKRAKATTVYEVRVRMDDGSVRTLTRSTAPTPGERVVVEGNSMRAAPAQNNGGEGA
jgi:outer membrane lipoprotein SlyB